MSSQLVESAFSFLAGDLSPESALSVLGGSHYGIVLDPGSNPVSVVSRADLTGEVKLKASELVSPPAWLPATIVKAFRASLWLGAGASHVAAFSDAIGDPGPGRSIQVPTGAVFCREENCGYPNKVVYFPKGQAAHGQEPSAASPSPETKPIGARSCLALSSKK